jgi:sporulation protein YlmC with PRC-barrel domain
MRETEVDLALRLLDDQVIDSEGTRCGRVDDVELQGGPGQRTEVGGLLLGSGAWPSRLPRPFAAAADFLLPDYVQRVPWECVADVETTVKLSVSEADLGLGTGEGRNARLNMLVDDGGEVTCNGKRHALPGPLLLRARQVARDLGEQADLGLHLPRGQGSVLSYRVQVEQGTVSFSDTSPRQPKVFLALQQLTKDISEDVCGLRR